MDHFAAHILSGIDLEGFVLINKYSGLEIKYFIFSQNSLANTSQMFPSPTARESRSLVLSDALRNGGGMNRNIEEL